MKKLLGGLGLLTLMAFFVFVAPGQAASTSKKITITPKHSYNVSKEVTLTGTVSSVVKKPSAGMLIGTHVMLNTANGGVDAHIGSYAGRDKRLDSLSQGETVKAVGMMTKTKHGQVFLVRTIEAHGNTITVRNKNGFLIGPAAPKYKSTAQARVHIQGGAQ